MKKIAAMMGMVGLVSTIGFLIPFTYASSNLNSYVVTYQGKVISQPNGFVKDNTTYMPVNDILKIMKGMNTYATWVNENLIIGNPLPVDLPHVLPPTSSTNLHVYVDGRLIATVPCVRKTDESGQQMLSYLPVWYVMNGLNQAGQKSQWNGHQWNLDSQS